MRQFSKFVFKKLKLKKKKKSLFCFVSGKKFEFWNYFEKLVSFLIVVEGGKKDNNL